MRTTSASLGSMGGLLLFLAVVAPCLGDDDGPKVIPASEARQHVGERRTVEMTVKSSHFGSHKKTYFLDSEDDYHDEKNLAVVISLDEAEKFKRVGVNNPAEYYRGKTIRVTGKVIEEDDQVRIRVTDPTQVKLVAAAKS
jgi:hypothetical protein